MKTRLDKRLVELGLVTTRSQAESYVKLGKVKVDGRPITKPGLLVNETARIKLMVEEQYVSRAALKVASVAKALRLDFRDKVVLDVGSSTGGFTDYALRQGAKRVIAVDVGKNQLHPSLRDRPEIELHEQTDIRSMDRLSQTPDIVLIDVSFISLREILPAVARLVAKSTEIVAMVKPQFETEQSGLKHRGVIKNDQLRRQIIKSFETWVQASFVIINKADSAVAGARGNQERFYALKKA